MHKYLILALGLSICSFGCGEGKNPAPKANLPVTETPPETPPDDEVPGKPQAPKLSGADIGKGPYYTDDKIVVTLGTVHAADGGGSVRFAYQWYKNGFPIAGATLDRLAGSAFDYEDEVFVQVTPRNKHGEGLPVHSNTVTISNSWPVFSGVSIGDGPYGKADTITATMSGWFDADGHAEGYQFAWWVSDEWVEVSEGQIDGAHFSRGDTVAVLVWPYDGISKGASLWSNTVTIGNSPPTLAGVSIGQGPYYKTDVIAAELGSASDPDNDMIGFDYRWFVDGNFTGKTGTALLGQNHFSKGQTVAVEVTPRDMHAHGRPVWSNAVTIANSPPVMSSVSLGAGPFSRNGTLSAAVSSADPDGDTVVYHYRWFVDGALVSESGPSLTGSFPSAVTVFVEVTPDDLTDLGAPMVSAAVLVNLPPSAPGVMLFSALAGPETRKIWAKVVTESTDPDGDELTYRYAWLRNGVMQTEYSSDTTMLTVTESMAGGVWRAEVSASDGVADSPAGAATLSIGFVGERIAAGGSHTCVLTTSAEVVCWGENLQGQLGVGIEAYRETPVAVSGLAQAMRAIAAGQAHTCALTNNGDALCWGSNMNGQLGDGSSAEKQRFPVPVTDLPPGVKTVSAGQAHTCALTDGGGVQCWGNNAFGQLGTGDLVERRSPSAVTGFDVEVQALALGYTHSCALTIDGRVWCWGDNAFGKSGIGAATPTKVTEPAEIAGFSGAVSIAAGQSHSCALMQDGGVKCWGDNFFGQLGTGDSNTRYAPAAVIGLAGPAVAIGAQQNHTCALIADGSVQCWGANNSGQLGTGDTLKRNTPVTVTGLTGGVQAIALGNSHTCALMASGGVKCWGDSSLGKLGNPEMKGMTPDLPVSGFVP